MKALVFTAIRELQVLEVEDPATPGPGQAIVQVMAAGICGSDLHGYTGRTGRRQPPLIMGHEAAGVVVAIGEGVTNVAVGDRVAIHPLTVVEGKRRLMGMDDPGAYAERAAWPAANLYPIPATLAFEAAAMAEPLAVALHAVGKLAHRTPGSVLVVGGGAIGALVGLVASSRGWGPVMVADVNPARLEAAGRLGFIAVDANDTSAVQAAVRSAAGDGGVDAAFEAVGASAPVALAHSAVRYGGDVVWVGNSAKVIEVDMQQVVTRELTVQGTYGLSDADFVAALELLAAGTIEVGTLISKYARLEEGPELFEELLATPELIKGMFVFGSS